MFTGLIEARGEVMGNQPRAGGHRLVIRTPFEGVLAGDSIAVNGVCLTALLDEETDALAFDVSPETLQLTTLGSCRVGEAVNIERAMLASTRFGGHYVSGHVDTTACLNAITVMDDYTAIGVSDFGVAAKRYLLPKGSIALDGVSLTINTVEKDSITVMLVPHTLSVTTLGRWHVGQRVNVEFDYLARIVAHQLEALSLTVSE